MPGMGADPPLMLRCSANEVATLIVRDQLPVVITRQASINSQQTISSTLYVCEV